jgi:hypothetical protein
VKSIADGFGGSYSQSYVLANDGNNVIPIPAAAWLFGSVVLGLIAIGRRRQNTTFPSQFAA